MNNKYRFLRTLAFFVCVLLVGIFFSCKSKTETVKTQSALGTLCTINLFESSSDVIFNEIFLCLDDIEQKMSTNIVSSEISQINQNAGIKSIVVSSQTFSVLEKAKEIALLSNGAFEPTIGPLVELWGINDIAGQTFYSKDFVNNNQNTLDNKKIPLPSKTQISLATKFVDYSKLLLDKNLSSVFLMQKNMSLEVGAIAKGYAADEIVKILDKHKVKRAMIDLGGNIFAYHYKNNDTKQEWVIGIKDPEDTLGNALMSIQCSNKSVVTSGLYERFFIYDGIRYHHILNPKTGYPVNNEFLSVTIISDTSMLADACSTAVFVLGLEKGIEFLNQFNNVDYIFILKNHSIIYSKDLDKKIAVFNSKYTLNTAVSNSL